MSGNRKNIPDAETEDASDIEPEFTYEQLMADMQAIHSSYGVPDLRPGEFTAVMYAERFGLDRGAAMREIADAITAGEVVEVGEERRVNGKRVHHVYRKAK